MATGIASSLRAVARQGVGPETRLVAIGSPDPLHLTRQVFAAFRAGRHGVPELTVATPLDEMLRALDAYQPEAIAGYPTVAALPADGPAGRPYRRLASVEGRSSDVLELPGLRGGTVAVHPFRLGRPLAAFPDVRQFQLGRDGTAIVMEVVLRPRAARDVPGRLRTAIVRELEAAGAVAPPVAVEAVAAIARETGGREAQARPRAALTPDDRAFSARSARCRRRRRPRRGRRRGSPPSRRRRRRRPGSRTRGPRPPSG